MNGYTCNVPDGQSFEDFVLTCAKAIGYFITQRDSDNPKVEKPKLKTYYKLAVEEAEKELINLEALSPTERQKQCENYNNGNIKSIEDSKKRYEKSLADIKALENMRTKVEAWKAGDEKYKALRDFMITQLNDTIKFDTPSKKDFVLERKNLKILLTDQWYEMKKATVKQEIKYYGKHWEEEQQNHKEKCEYLDGMNLTF